MKAILDRILVFGENNEKREVSFTDGLNIITGDSKTGKSALLEIVDYCLFSSRSTIPKGVVENFSILYSIILKTNDKYIIIARPSSRTGNGGKAFLRIETNESIPKSIDITFFDSLTARTLKDVQLEVEKHLGLSVSDTRMNEEEDRVNAGKASLRSFVPFLFQHQNLIANKHSVFYRFDDFYKRKKTIDDYPVIIGWEHSEYFLYSRELEQKQKELKIFDKQQKSLELGKADFTDRLETLLTNYFSTIGLELQKGLPLAELKKIANNLPDFKNSSNSEINLNIKHKEKEAERQELKEKLDSTQDLINALEKNSGLSYDHTIQLNFLSAAGSVSSTENLACPICLNPAPKTLEKMETLKVSRENLQRELVKISTYTEDNSQQIEILRKERNDLKRKIGKISSEMTFIESQNKELKKTNSLRDQAIFAKGVTQSNINYLFSLAKDSPLSKDRDALVERISWLTSKLSGFDLKAKISKAEAFLSETMTTICNSLDFEEELKPGVLRFTLNDFVFYYNFMDKEKIHLSEMGSGANWLACHLSLFLSLLHLNCAEKNSSIPAFLIIDQPSQVYFPTRYGQDEEKTDAELDENIQQVINIFRVILNSLASIQKDSGFLPQVIVLEHADEPEFKDYVRARWKKNGEKLI